MKRKTVQTDPWQFKNQGLHCNIDTFLYTDVIPSTSLKCDEKAVKCWGDTAGYSSFSPESNFPLLVRCNFVLLHWMQSRGRNLFHFICPLLIPFAERACGRTAVTLLWSLPVERIYGRRCFAAVESWRSFFNNFIVAWASRFVRAACSAHI